MARFRLRSPDKIQLTENDVEKQCLDYLALHRYRPVRLQSGLFTTLGKNPRPVTVGEPGLPDYVIPLFFMEVKRPGGKLSPAQVMKIRELELDGHGVPVAVVDSLEALIEWLDRYQKKG